jgi:hypothetical protein
LAEKALLGLEPGLAGNLGYVFLSDIRKSRVAWRNAQVVEIVGR